MYLRNRIWKHITIVIMQVIKKVEKVSRDMAYTYKDASSHRNRADKKPCPYHQVKRNTEQLLTCAAEIIFIRNILCFLGVDSDYTIVVRCDNVGALFLGFNAKTSQRTNHIDIKAHFIREYVDQGIVKIIFVKSEDNVSDIWTKNTDQQTFWRHIIKIMKI